MNPDMRQRLRQLLVKHEGYKNLPYLDSTNNVTIGIGRNLTDRGVSPSEINFMCDNDIDYFNQKLSVSFEWFNSLNEARQIALIDMCFNLGFRNFCLFHEMIASLKKSDFETASNDMIDSTWSRQVGDRAIELAHIIKTGEMD